MDPTVEGGRNGWTAHHGTGEIRLSTGIDRLQDSALPCPVKVKPISSDPANGRSAERKSEGVIVSCEGVDNTTHRSEGPLAERARLLRNGCELANLWPPTRKARRQTLKGDRLSTCGPVVGSAGPLLNAKLEAFANGVENRNVDARRFGGKPDEGEPHVRFGKGALETGLTSYRARALFHRENRTHGLKGGCGNGLARAPRR